LPDLHVPSFQAQGHGQFILRIIQGQDIGRVADNAPDRLNTRRVKVKSRQAILRALRHGNFALVICFAALEEVFVKGSRQLAGKRHNLIPEGIIRAANNGQLTSNN
jgi:hypothetical protein